MVQGSFIALTDVFPVPKDRYGVIYVITHKESGKQYVGQTMRTIERRWKGHKDKARRLGKLPMLVSRAIRAHGPDAFTIETLDWAFSKAELDEKEKAWIDLLSTMAPDGYNLKEGGARGPLGLEARARMAATKRGQKLPDTHPFVRKTIVPWNKGIPCSPEMRARISATKHGKAHPNSGSFKCGLVPWNKGKTMSREYRHKAGNGVRKANSGSFKKGHPSGVNRGKIGLPSGPNGEIRYFRPDQLI